MLKKPSILFTSYNNLQTLCCPHTGLPTPSFPHPPPQETHPPKRRKPQRRSYATAQDDRPPPDAADLTSWPSASTSTVPSPYQILHLSPRSPYSKHRFYALVKLYHPDRSGHTYRYADIHHLPRSVKIERYRLIVAAHDILSNPDKRNAYDRTGAGWNSRLEPTLHPAQYSWSHTSGETRWSAFDTDDSPFRNATWEDWERWYRRHEKQDPVYMNNGGFASLIVVALVLGAFGQSAQVSRHGTLFKEQVEVKHERAAQMMLKHKGEGRRVGDLDHRLQRFNRGKDVGGPVGLGDVLRNGGEDGEFLPEPVVGRSDEIQTQRGSGGSREDT